MRIVDGIYLVGGDGYNLSSGCNVYVVDAGDELFLIDIGHKSDVKSIEENLMEEGMKPKDISIILITHSHLDHAGGAAEAKQAFNSKIAANELTAKNLEVSLQKKGEAFTQDDVEIKLCGGEVLRSGDLEIEVLNTPGHTREGGDLCYKIEMDGKIILFSGDTAFKCWGGLMGGHPVSAWLGSVSLEEAEIYLKTLKNLQETVKPDILLPGHWLLALRDGWKELRECATVVSKHIKENLIKE